MNDMTATAAPAASVSLAQITFSEDFGFRAGGVDPAHKADLASTIRNTGRALDLVLLWQPDADQPEKLISLDGGHRVAAYRAAKWSGEIPALVLVGVIDGRLSKRVMGLSQAERIDAAWRLVREPVTPRFKVREIAYLADVAARTVDYMRQRFRTMHEEGIEITGSWARDRHTLGQGDDDTGGLSDDQREAEIEKLAGEIRDLVDRRKHPERAILRESEAVYEAVQVALGEQAMKAMLAWLFGGDEAGDWLEMASAGDDDIDGGGEGDEAEPAF